MNARAHKPLAPMRLVEISQAARTLGVTARTLRHYQDRGLIRSHRLARNVRGYDLNTLEQLKAIIVLRAAGLPIQAIQEIMALRDRPDAQIQALSTVLTKALSEQWSDPIG